MPGACVAITGLDPTPVQLVADGGHVGGMWRAFGKVVAKPNKEERVCPNIPMLDPSGKYVESFLGTQAKGIIIYVELNCLVAQVSKMRQRSHLRCRANGGNSIFPWWGPAFPDDRFNPPCKVSVCISLTSERHCAELRSYPGSNSRVEGLKPLRSSPSTSPPNIGHETVNYFYCFTW